MKPCKYPVLVFMIVLALLPPCSGNSVIIKDNNRLTKNVLNNTTYHIGELGTIRLDNGKFKHRYGEGATQINEVTVEKIAFGDLNGDGLDDAAVVLTWQNGGSGTFKYLVAIQNVSGLPRQMDSILLGDRIQIREMSISDGKVALDELTFGSRDPMCCPSQSIKQTYSLRSGKWMHGAGKSIPENIATGSTEMLDADIIGTVWKWERFNDTADLHNIVIDDPDNYTLILLSNGTYQAKADCNRMQGQYTLEGKRIKLTPGPTTIAECLPGSQYAGYLKRLNEVVSFVLHKNKLVLNLMIDGGDMVFKNGGSIHDNGGHP
ncbi:MAG: META domain-containing protein [Gammaproteobacteria bacterium]